MKPLHKLYAAYFIGYRHHSGMWSIGYRMGCWANTELRARGITDPYRWPMRNWPKQFRSDFRRYYRILWKRRNSF